MQSDRRRYSRRTEPLNFRILVDGAERSGIATNISATGAFIEGTKAPDPGTQITLIVRPPGVRVAPVRVDCVVVRTVPIGGMYPAGYAIRFLRASCDVGGSSVYQVLRKVFKVPNLQPQHIDNGECSSFDFPDVGADFTLKEIQDDRLPDIAPTSRGQASQWRSTLPLTNLQPSHVGPASDGHSHRGLPRASEAPSRRTHALSSSKPSPEQAPASVASSATADPFAPPRRRTTGAEATSVNPFDLPAKDAVAEATTSAPSTQGPQSPPSDALNEIIDRQRRRRHAVSGWSTYEPKAVTGQSSTSRRSSAPVADDPFAEGLKRATRERQEAEQKRRISDLEEKRKGGFFQGGDFSAESDEKSMVFQQGNSGSSSISGAMLTGVDRSSRVQGARGTSHQVPVEIPVSYVLGSSIQNATMVTLSAHVVELISNATLPALDQKFEVNVPVLFKDQWMPVSLSGKLLRVPEEREGGHFLTFHVERTREVQSLKGAYREFCQQLAEAAAS